MRFPSLLLLISLLILFPLVIPFPHFLSFAPPLIFSCTDAYPFYSFLSVKYYFPNIYLFTSPLTGCFINCGRNHIYTVTPYSYPIGVGVGEGAHDSHLSYNGAWCIQWDILLNAMQWWVWDACITFYTALQPMGRDRGQEGEKATIAIRRERMRVPLLHQGIERVIMYFPIPETYPGWCASLYAWTY